MHWLCLMEEGVEEAMLEVMGEEGDMDRLMGGCWMRMFAFRQEVSRGAPLALMYVLRRK
jgi:hypothetical protein